MTVNYSWFTLTAMLVCAALIGYGYWGPNVARAIQKLPNVKLSFICDKDPQKIQNAKRDYPFVETCSDIDIVLNNPNIDAVILATPANSHQFLATETLKSGKHILVEKPLALSTEQVKKIQAAATKSGKIVMVGHTFEYNPATLKTKKIINEASFGNVLYAYSTRVNLGQIRGDVNALWNLAPHDISIFNKLFDSIPTEVMAVGSTFLQTKVEDVVFATLRYPNNITAQIHVSWLDPQKERKLTIVGSKKMLIFDDINNEMPLKIFDKRVETGDVAKGIPGEYKIKLHSGDIYVPQIENKEPLLEELRHFFDCIISNKQPITDIQNGLNVVKVLEGCQISLQESNRWVKI